MSVEGRRVEGPRHGLRQLVEQATPGPWTRRERGYRVLTNVGEAYPAGGGRFAKWEDAKLAALATAG